VEAPSTTHIQESMKPKCETCGDRHELYQAHVWPKTNVVVNTTPVVVNTDKVVVNKRSAKRSADRHKKTPERAAYQREYMRKIRAKD
jgi:hypothetical protein